MILPPTRTTSAGEIRRIGVEIEFGGVDCLRAAELVCTLFGGVVEQSDNYRYHVRGTSFGTFLVELDSQYAHGSEEATNGRAKEGGGTQARILDKVGREAGDVVADISALWVPVEIVSPPVPIDRLPELDVIVDALRQEGAEGTDQGLLYAFGTQLNPEAPSNDTESVRDHFQSFLLLADWLRTQINLDVKRRLLPFVDPFPRSYVRKVLTSSYAPSMVEFIDDYLAANPTRNRELDMLPLFLHLDPERVCARMDDPRIKARPTYHYRLPDTRLSEPQWGLIKEWNRWVEVERLAADPDRKRDLLHDFETHEADWFSLKDWASRVQQWMT
jgi:hypothetical protein